MRGKLDNIGKYEMFMTEGNPLFIADLDNISLGKDINTAESRYAKVMLLANLFLEDNNEIASMILVGHSLIYGCESPSIKMIDLCKSVDELNITKELNIIKDYTEKQMQDLIEMKTFIKEVVTLKQIA